MSTHALSSISVSEVLPKAWNVLKDNMKEVLIGGLVYALVTQVPSYVIQMVFGQESGIGGILGLVLQIWSIYVSLGFTRYMLGVIRGQHPTVELIFNNTADFVKYFIINIRYMLVVFGGLLLLVIPGIYFAIKYMYVPILVADNKADGSDAFKMSGKMTDGNMMNLFIYGLVVAVLVGIGMVALVIPGIVAAIIGGLGGILIYEFLLKKVK
jgi:hypothetical protein